MMILSPIIFETKMKIAREWIVEARDAYKVGPGESFTVAETLLLSLGL
jgi:hypothetical protein